MTQHVPIGRHYKSFRVALLNSSAIQSLVRLAAASR